MRRFTSVILVATASIPLMAQADQMPKLKHGLWLWDMTVTAGIAGVPPQSIKMCIDAATDPDLIKSGVSAPANQKCSKNELKSDGKTVTADTVCSIGGSQITSHSITSFTGDSAYHTEIKSHYAPPILGLEDVTLTQDVKLAGPCPADMQPGDMIGPGGQKMNINQMIGK